MAKYPESSLERFDIGELSGTRCRLQRLRDLRFFAGWIRKASAQKLEVELVDGSVEVGDQFQFEAAIELGLVRFTCDCIELSDQFATLGNAGEVHFGTPGQEPRYRSSTLTAKLTGFDFAVECDVVDLSISGLGIEVPDPMPRFATVKVTVDGPYGSVKCKGMVRYCRPAEDGYRVGLQIEFEDRLSNAMWMRLLNRASSGLENAA
jgi:hypothetical protein